MFSKCVLLLLLDLLESSKCGPDPLSNASVAYLLSHASAGLWYYFASALSAPLILSLYL